MGYQTDIHNVAKALLSIRPMSHKKLQKLCYYYYAWHLVLLNDEPFRNKFEAWIHGPVDRELYQEYKSFGWVDIHRPNGEEEVPEDVMAFARNVYEAYGHLDADQLEYLTHQEEPWLKARGGALPHEPVHTYLSKETIEKFFKEKMEGNQVE